MLTIKDLLSSAQEELQKCGLSSARRESEELLSTVLKMKRLELYLDFERPLISPEIELFHTWLQRRKKREPLQYIRGETEFLNCKIKVTPDVLIPRQETELLASKIIEKLSKQDLTGKVLLDLCCGSGCLGIALKKALPELNVILSDVSEAALSVARQNAALNDVSVSFLQGDLLTPFVGQKAHFLVCNPPYVATHEFKELDPEVKDFEPYLALVGGNTGLEFYERLAKELPGHIEAGGLVWMEIGYGQGEPLLKIFEGSPWKKRGYELDWSSRDRFFLLEIE